MNELKVAVAIACVLAAPAPAQENPQPVGSNAGAAAIVADCSSRKFETRVEIEKDGEKRLTKLKLCAVKGSDEASWVRTLEDAMAKIAAHPDISDESKAKITAELSAEITRLDTGKAASSAAPAAPAASSVRQPEMATPPPLKTQPALAVASAAKASKPRLTIRCLEPGETGPGSPCTLLERETRLAIVADENLTGSTGLRFLRRGDNRGELALAGMRQGQSIRARLPDKLCIGVSSSKVEIQVVSSNQVVETLGPYKLRC